MDVGDKVFGDKDARDKSTEESEGDVVSLSVR